VATDGRAAMLTTDRLIDLLDRRDVALAHHRSAVARTLGVSGTELLALVHLARRGDMTASDLAELLDLSAGGVTALVQRLAAAGHVTRRPDPGRRRSTRMRVTPATARALRAADAPLRAALDTVPRGLSGEQQSAVDACLVALAERCEQLAERARAVPSGGVLEQPVPGLSA
jgi:DNA-binding MarR family transcriptional regulator